jgi:hypothetical protein
MQHRMISEQWTDWNVEGSDCVQLQVQSKRVPEGTEENNEETSVGMAEIWIRDMLNEKQGCQLFDCNVLTNEFLMSVLDEGE